jgi:hypothetical protein
MGDSFVRTAGIGAKRGEWRLAALRAAIGPLPAAITVTIGPVWTFMHKVPKDRSQP